MNSDRLTFSQRASDATAHFAGSWAFVICSFVFVGAWMLLQRYSPFDPYPYIALNLALTVISTLQSPVIMMSQNRQAEREKATEAAQAERDREMVREILTAVREMNGHTQSPGSLTGDAGLPQVVRNAQAGSDHSLSRNSSSRQDE